MQNYISFTVESLLYSNNYLMLVRDYVSFFLWSFHGLIYLGALKKGPIDQYLNEARGNSHKKALLCAAYATTQHDENAAAEFMQVSLRESDWRFLVRRNHFFRKLTNIYPQQKKKIDSIFGIIRIKNLKNRRTQLFRSLVLLLEDLILCL